MIACTSHAAGVDRTASDIRIDALRDHIDSFGARGIDYAGDFLDDSFVIPGLGGVCARFSGVLLDVGDREGWSAAWKAGFGWAPTRPLQRMSVRSAVLTD